MAEDATALRASAIALHKQQRLIEAEAQIVKAQLAAPDDPVIAFMLAQFRYELGYNAIADFATAQALWPDNAELIRNHALALHSEARSDEARAMLENILASNPQWVNGHQTLSTILWTSGYKESFADSFAKAARANAANAPLWLGWFQAIAQSRDWDGASAILDEAGRYLKNNPTLLAAQLFVACESNAANAAALLEDTRHLKGESVSLCRIRHALRRGDAKCAEAEAGLYLSTLSAPIFWPYMSLVWRLLGDDRAEWLDQPNQLIQRQDDVLSQAELTELASLLRTLHTTKAPYLEQSIRGGTQTDRSVLLRHEPIIQKTRVALLQAIQTYVDALPPHDPTHPLLDLPRNQPLLIEGSWSVRLLPDGHNLPHTHPKGWLSTAFYVDIPSVEDMGSAPAGHISFGTPPPELGLPLEPYKNIAPISNRLAIFPSTSWHATIPFDAGERLVIAFDIAQPTGA